MPLTQMSTLSLLSSTQSAVATALARGVSIAQVEKCLAAVISEISQLQPDYSAEDRIDEELQLVSSAPPTAISRARPPLPDVLPPPSLASTPIKLLPVTAPPSTAIPLAPVTPPPSTAIPLALSASAPNLGLESVSPSAKPKKHRLRDTASATSRLVVDTSLLRHQARDSLLGRCPLDIYTTHLQDFLRESKKRTLLEKEQKGLGNPIIGELKLPSFTDELKARERRRL